MDTSMPAPEEALRERLAENLQAMVDEAEQLLKTAQRSGNEQFLAARDKFEAQVKHARSALDDLQKMASYNMHRAAKVADTAVHDHPYAAAGLAAGIGVLVGMLISRR
jgi:ElaB/YqjD/DUF883 family membrane-anchored ribosome-binding protein